MFLRSVLVCLLTVATVFCCAPVFAGKVELTTYYPAPFGEYQELNSTGNTHLAKDPGTNVGIGTTTPQNKLDVEGSAAIGTNYSGANAAPADGLLVEGRVGIGTITPAAKLDIAGEIRLSGSGLACSAATEGSMRYNSGTKAIQFCNGNAWVSAGDSGIHCDFDGTWFYNDSGDGNDFAITCKDHIVTGWCGSTPPNSARGLLVGNYVCEG